jgi:hypothetical protein
MDQFAFSGSLVPGLGPDGYNGFTARSRYDNKAIGGEDNFNGGDPGLQYRFWNQAENGYKGSQIDGGTPEEAAFLDNLFACRKQCKDDLGGASNLRDCIRNCKGKGLTKSALKTKEAETSAKMADALSKAAEPEVAPKSNKTLWIVVGIVAVIIIALIIYFLRKKSVPVVAE